MNNEYYIERQKKWIDEVGLKVGDKVMLVGDPDPWRLSNGLNRLYHEYHRQGGFYYVQDVEENLIVVDDRQNSGTGNYFPFYVLLKINE